MHGSRQSSLGATLTRWAIPVAGCAISAFFAATALRNVDFHTFRHAVASSDPRWIALSLLALAAAVVVRTMRWQVLFDPRTRPPFDVALRALLIGYLFNNIMPARAGEAARVVVLHRELGSSRAEVAGTAITERVYDVLSLLAIFFVAAPFLPHVTWLHRAAVAAIVVAVATVAVALVGKVWGHRPLRPASAALGRLPWLERSRVDQASVNLLSGLAAFWRPSLIAPALGLTVASWLLIALSGWFAVLALHLALPFGAGVLLAVTTNLAMVLPSSPGALGVFEAAALLALGAYGVASSAGLACAVVLHAINFFPYLALGAVCLRVHTVRCRRPRASPGPVPIPSAEGIR